MDLFFEVIDEVWVDGEDGLDEVGYFEDELGGEGDGDYRGCYCCWDIFNVFRLL